MLVTQHPVFRRFWYPVVPIARVQQGPQAFCLLGQDLVLWLDRTGRPAAALDRCRYCSARLSLGTVQDDCLQCASHGCWQLNADRKRDRIPQLSDRPVLETERTQTFRCDRRYGYVWVCLDDPISDIPEIPEAEDPRFRYIPQFYEVWNCAALRLMENSFDNAHPHFVHAQTFGLQQSPIPPAPDSFTETAEGFQMTYRLPAKNTEVQKRNLRLDEPTTVRTSQGNWFLPFTRSLKITYPNGLVHLIFTAATPISDRSIQVLQFCLRNDTEAEAKASEIVAFDRQVTLEDKVVLESTDFDVPLRLQDEQHMVSDKPGIIMRRRLAALIERDERKNVERTLRH